jgi:prophage tail gpP-like protein
MPSPVDSNSAIINDAFNAPTGTVVTARDSTLSLIVGGQRYEGWTDVRVTRSIEHGAADFEIGCTQVSPGQDTRFVIPEGSTCEIWIGNDKVLTGYVDVIGIEREAEQASCRIAGRSKTGDLIDCSPNHTEVELAGQDLASIARNVCAPFGIDVVAANTGATYAVAAKHHGETAWKMIERLARQRRLLVLDDEQGRLVLAQLATTVADDKLVYPSDGLKKLSTKRDSSKRFSVYTTDGSDPSIGGTLAHVEGVIYDRGVTRYRPKTIQSEGAAKKEGALQRAEWEARRAIGHALRVGITRVGWRQLSSGALWKPNLLVPTVVPSANIDQQLALATVHYIKSGERGTVCDLELAPPDAFTPEPPDAPNNGAGQGGRWSGMGTAISGTPS